MSARPRKPIRWEGIALGVLVVTFLVFAINAERIAQEFTAKRTPSAFNAASEGAKALYLLLERQGFAISHLRAPWDSLTEKEGLLVVIEPLDESRKIQPAEITALKRWVEQGGTVFYLMTSPARPLDAKDPLFGEVAILSSQTFPFEAKPAVPNAAYTRDVRSIKYESPVRLAPAATAKYQILLKDEQGALLIHKPLGKGHLLAGAMTSIASNRAIAEADNALLLAQIAQTAIGQTSKGVAFDEYHHGVGFEREVRQGKSLLTALPRPIVLAFFHLVVFGLFLVYNGNRRFGALRSLSVPAFRPSTDYVGAMAQLFQRAGATEIAMQTLYQRFIADLSRALNLPPDAPRDALIRRAVEQFQWNGAQLEQTLRSCEAATQARVSEADLLAFAQRLDEYRRQFQRVG